MPALLTRMSRRPRQLSTLGTVSCQAVSDVIGNGIVPAALEMMDNVTIGAVEAHYRAGYPTDAGAVLLAEVDGLVESAQELTASLRQVLERNQAYNLRVAEDEAERELLWAGRKGAIGALGRIKPNYYLHDGVVPRTRLPEVLRRVNRLRQTDNWTNWYYLAREYLFLILVIGGTALLLGTFWDGLASLFWAASVCCPGVRCSGLVRTAVRAGSGRAATFCSRSFSL